MSSNVVPGAHREPSLSIRQRRDLFFEAHPWLPSVIKILSYIGYGLIASMVLITLFLKIVHIQPMAVVSNSMVPTFSRGDMILVSHNYQALAKGDIVVYHQQVPNRDVVHRIINISGNVITVKGDANEVADAPFQRSAVRGEVISILPKIGYLSMYYIQWLIIIATVILSFITEEWKIRFDKRALPRHSSLYLALARQKRKDVPHVSNITT